MKNAPCWERFLQGSRACGRDFLFPTAAKESKNAAGGEGFRTPSPPVPLSERPMGAAAPFGIPQGCVPPVGGESKEGGRSPPPWSQEGIFKGRRGDPPPLEWLFCPLFQLLGKVGRRRRKQNSRPAGANPPCPSPGNKKSTNSYTLETKPSNPLTVGKIMLYWQL